ncbi:MAG: TIGR03118 family protein, partial [Verrucomicrobia bacterium]|nr:TIGR03118 family protein [Verrucomicrobiota bacterium]
NSDPPGLPDNALFFTAGPNMGHDGLFGTLTPVAADLTQGSDQ